MSGNGFFDVREKLQTPRASTVAAARAGENAISVTQLTRVIDQAIRAGVPARVCVRGEVSNFTHVRGSGHAYFTLKDTDACVNCVMFRSDFEKLKFLPNNGMELLAIGSVKVFATQGRYQLYANSLQPLGKGALELAFQQLRAKLEAEGLFDPARKKALPRYPVRIAIVTSRETAAYQDILKVLNRFPWITAQLFHVPVQGEGCGPEIAAAIAAVNRKNNADVILLSRGGGSLEDLWGFNHETVARAVAASVIPVVTGIGHEVDTSIADLVADHHAHTPTEAAQVVTAYWRNIHDDLTNISQRLGRHTAGILQQSHHRLLVIERHEFFRRPTDRINDLNMRLDDRQRALLQGLFNLLQKKNFALQQNSDRLQRQTPTLQLQRASDRLQQAHRNLLLALQSQLRKSVTRLEKNTTLLAERHPRNSIALANAQLNSSDARLKQSLRNQFRRQTDRIAALSAHLEAVSPQRVLERGYTVTRFKKSGTIVRSSKELKEYDAIVTRFADGEVESKVEDQQQPKLF